MYQLRKLSYAHLVASAFLVGVLVLELLGVSLVTRLFQAMPAEAATVTVDATVSGTARTNNHTGAQTVFTTDVIGYTFYRDSNGTCAYRKTTDAGATWGSTVTVDAQTDCIRIVVWYDQWTPGDTGDTIHIATMDTNPNDELFYNSLDTSTDTLLLGSSPVSATANPLQSPTFSAGVNTHSITKATDGEIYMAANDNGDSFAVSCSSTCSVGTNWSEVGTSPFDTRNDHNLLMPLSGGQVLLINRDISANDLRSKIWNGSTWSASWTTIDANAPESAEYDGGMSATINLSNGNIYLAYAADNNNLTDNNDDIRTAIFDGSAWTNMADVITDVTGRGLMDVAIAIDQNNGDTYVAYAIQDTAGTVGTGNIYYKESTDAMTSWGTETGPVNATADDIRKPALDPSNLNRLYVAWWINSGNDRLGETLDDIGPDSTLMSLGNQTTEVRSATTDNYLGGAFVINSLNSNSVSSVTVSETGTVDAATGLENIKLFYDLDTSAPYDCTSESYSGAESQFGSTIAGGFDAVDGQAIFTGSVIGVSPTQAMCLYVVVDTTVSAVDGATIAVEISDPPNDITITGSDIAPTTAVSITGNTTVVSPELTQTHYHWRNDDGSEAAATSATGGAEDTPLTALSVSTPVRLRLQASVEGSTSTDPIAYQLQFAPAAPTCEAVTGWINVDAADDAFNMQSSVNLTDGGDTTNIAVSTGGVSDENVTFLTPNGGVQDTGDTTGSITLESDEFVEFEFALVASTSAVEGTTYCFRLSDSGNDIGLYDVYPQATINSEVTVGTIGAQIANVDIPTTDVYFGGAISIVENNTSHSVTSVTITETGTIDAETGLNNIQLFYDLDTSAPYDCTSESYSGAESQFGATDTDGMSAANGSSTFTGSVSITTTQAMCLYVVADVTTNSANGETVAFSIAAPATDILASGASISPSTPIVISGDTQLRGAIVTQTHYHWRNDDGSEAGATSATAGSEDTPLLDFQIDSPIRLRLQLSNEGATSSMSSEYRLEYAEKVTTCSAIATWIAVDGEADDDWDIINSANLTHGGDTTNIAVIAGGLTDENSSFVTANTGVRDTSASTSALALSETEFVEYEFSITSTVATAFSTDYCFRLAPAGSDLDAYSAYAELSTATKRDFKTQNGNVTLTGTTDTITAGIDYVAPASTSLAFIRITNTNNTGAGDTVLGGSQDVEENTVYIQNPDNLDTSITFARDRALNDTFVDWEIIEFIAQPGTDNEMFVRDVGTVSMAGGTLTTSGSAVSGIADDADVVVFVTGVSGNDTGNDFFGTQVSANWNATTSQPEFTRGADGGSQALVSYAVVEFTGLNWQVQRVEHTYTAAGVAETESITPVTSPAQAFIVAQKHMGANTQVASLGHQVYLSGMGTVAFELNSSANMTITHTSVAWVVENLQTGVGAMQVERQDGTSQSGSEPLAQSEPIVGGIDAVNNSSIFGNSSANGTNNAHPRATAGLRILSTSAYQIWRSDTGSQLQYRTEIVQWPVADLTIRQNYYRIYADNNQLTPDDPWPVGVDDLGENTSVTEFDDPPGIDEVMRIRMTLRAVNANWPADFFAFKLQYAERVSTCTAVGVWTDVGQAGSGEIWRGFAATGTTDGTDLSTDPPTPGDLLLSVSDVAGVLVHENQSATNTHIAYDGEDVEYDWYIQHNGAAADTTYCFRAVEADGTDLTAYLQYPQIRTADFTPEVTNWRWYDDIQNETPSTPLAALNAAPTEIAASTTLALRVVLDEQKNVNGEDVKFKLQYSEDINFTTPIDVAPSTTCSNANEWCYVDGGGLNNATITTAITGTSDSCVAQIGSGCGTHNSSADYVVGHDHSGLAAQEYSFTIQSRKLRSSTVYYFRLYDVASARAVNLFDTASNPAVVAESARLVFTIDGLPAGTSTAGLTTGVTTTPASIDFGVLPFNTDLVGAQRLSIDTNALEGYQIWKFAGQVLTNDGGSTIDNISSTNAAPASWATVCNGVADGCVGYHTTDATLAGGSARFAPTDTYAALHTTPEEIMYSSIPVDESHDILYRIEVTENQVQGDYTTTITYIATPVF